MEDIKSTRDSLTVEDLHASAERNRQWGRWGPDDELGTLNNVTPRMIADASKLVRKGKAFGLAMNFDSRGPYKTSPRTRRFNPIHVMLRTGADCCSPHMPQIGIFGADDMVTMPLQCGTLQARPRGQEHG